MIWCWKVRLLHFWCESWCSERGLSTLPLRMILVRGKQKKINIKDFVSSFQIFLVLSWGVGVLQHLWTAAAVSPQALSRDSWSVFLCSASCHPLWFFPECVFVRSWLSSKEATVILFYSCRNLSAPINMFIFFPIYFFLMFSLCIL